MRLFIALLVVTPALVYVLGTWIDGILSQVRF
jgi:hypothetical protein